MSELNNQLTRVSIAGQLLANAPMMKTKQAAQSVGDETLKLLGQLVETINQQSIEIEQLKERLP